MAGPKMTQATMALLRKVLENPTNEWYGLQLCDALGFPSGTVYPIISRLENAGIFVSREEAPEEYANEGRPPRRYYRFSTDGAARARTALAQASERQRRTARVRLTQPREV